jgi:hypothetical protein
MKQALGSYVKAAVGLHSGNKQRGTVKYYGMTTIQAQHRARFENCAKNNACCYRGAEE